MGVVKGIALRCLHGIDAFLTSLLLVMTRVARIGEPRHRGSLAWQV
jgi:hypothetical protein